MRVLERGATVVGLMLLFGGAYLLWNIYGGWPVPDGYEFPRHSMWGGGPTALFEGELVEQDGCIRTAGEYGATVVWPPGYYMRLYDNGVEVHGSGLVATIGSLVRLGGGSYELRSDLPEVLPETRCPPPFFLTTGFAD